MQKKWLLSLIFLTLLFFITGFFLKKDLMPAYQWMTMGMGVVSFVFYFTIVSSGHQDNNKIIGSHLTAIVLKFILSCLVVIFYIILFKKKYSLDFVFFFVAYGVYSLLSYTFSYYYKKA